MARTTIAALSGLPGLLLQDYCTSLSASDRPSKYFQHGLLFVCMSEIVSSPPCLKLDKFHNRNFQKYA